MAKKAKYVPWTKPDEVINKIIFHKQIPDVLYHISVANKKGVVIVISGEGFCPGYIFLNLTYEELLKEYEWKNFYNFPFEPYPCGREITEEPLYSR